MVDVKKYIASVSFGKDSLAMLLYILENRLPLDEVVFYDTGMEFSAIYLIRDKVKCLLKDTSVKYVELQPPRPFEFDMLIREKTKRDGTIVNGDGWCGGACRWGTFIKQNVINKYTTGAHVYVGIAADESSRLANLDYYKSSPIADAGMTESDCLDYCRQRGYSWLEKSRVSPSGYVDLYDILDRVSCWCCSNKNRKELKNMYAFLPDYWERLKALQSKIDMPMKKWSNKRFGDYGNVFDMERVFELELQNESTNDKLHEYTELDIKNDAAE